MAGMEMIQFRYLVSMLRITCFTILFLFGSFLYAQKIDTIYVGKNGFKTDNRDEAVEYKIIERQYDFDENGKISTYYKSGKLRSTGHYSSVKSAIPDGEFHSFYESGQKKTIENYEKGRLSGQLKTYYPNGQLRRDELYRNDSLLSGKCFGSRGQDTSYFKFRVLPQFPGGQPALVKFLVENIKYPKKARRKGIQETVYISFVVEKDGTVTSIIPLNKANDLLVAEALRIVRQMPPWSPGMEEGQARRVSFTLPIAFRLK